MFKNYLKIALRNIKRNKGFSFINIFGLAIGLTCSFLVFVYVFDEINYDRFHKDADRIYRIILNTQKQDSKDSYVSTSYILAKTLREDFPETFPVTQIKQRGSIITIDSENFSDERIICADNSFFDIFTYQFAAGNPENALNTPDDVIITEDAAEKYFGNAESYGKTILIDGSTYTITGIIKNDNQNSHFSFDVLFSIKSYNNYGDTRYLYNYYSTYVKLPPAVPESRLKDILAEYTEVNIAPQTANSDHRMYLSCEPILDIHLHSDLNGPYGANSKIEYVYIFLLVAFLILIIACINYINLTTAKNLSRIREVGIRKVVGSMSRQINRQFLLESLVFYWIATGIALILLSIFLPLFNNIIGKTLQLNYINDPLTILSFITMATIIGIASGVYPARYLSSYKPVKILKDNRGQGHKKFRLQSTLVVFQFTISVVFIISTLVINDQLGLVRDKDLGFDNEQVIVLDRAWDLGRQIDVFKDNLIKYPEIKNLSFSSSLPGKNFDSWSMTPEDLGSGTLGIYFCDHDFAETMGIYVQKGRFFSKNIISDENAIIINENAAEQFGWTEDPIGKKIRLNVHGDYTVIGVVKDFHYETLHNRIGNLGILLGNGRGRYMAIRYSTQYTAEVLDTIKKEWNSMIPNSPLEYSFLDEDYYRLYRSEEQMQKISSLFSFLAILISSLGLFGLVSFSVKKRTKEVGIRKALGASEKNILNLISREYLVMVVIANAIAWPTAYYFINKWLQQFAYRVDISIWIFVLSGLGALGIALLTVSYQSIKAATANPVDSLRYE